MTIDISGYVWPSGLHTLNVCKMRLVHLYSTCNYTRAKLTVLVVIRTFLDYYEVVVWACQAILKSLKWHNKAKQVAVL